MNNLPSLFNSPMESGLRSLTLLVAGFPMHCDLERLVIYDYLLVHSGDVDGGPKSIHPATPHRSGEILVKRPIVESGLKRMIAKGLVEAKYSKSGITYTATEVSSPFLDSLEADYTRRMIRIADWVIENFSGHSVEELKNLVSDHLDVWGGEFINESFVRGESHS
ncbi:ABC-three component system middle component 2 [Chromohalobacter sp. 11-W]|uniref:ABC-three component system middle component 2 n=1 Tax=Chromohalobacter sp. 11-W TaxID=2994061 RepID=UPI0017DD30D8|nr:ABC-three component system middle component 2 [Chromohalobacter sp. 11-W]NWO07501.1 threonine transporter [Alteromonadaceae bacterium]